MTTIIVNGEDRTAQLKDWKLKYNNNKQLELKGIFHSGKSYSWPFTECQIEPISPISGTLLRKKGTTTFQKIENAVMVGNKYVLYTYPGNSYRYLMMADKAEIYHPADYKDKALFSYLVEMAQARVKSASTDQTVIAENLANQLSKIIPINDTALHAYLAGNNARRNFSPQLIYPFGMNHSQIQAVEQAFSSQLSVIEGPPGTGKTQTILNIIANILMENKSVAVVSNNNAAVENVYQKLEEYGLGHVVAKLGSNDNKANFFAQLPTLPNCWKNIAPRKEEIAKAVTEIKSHLHAQCDKARYLAEIEELKIEEKYLSQWMSNHSISSGWPVEKYRLTPQKSTDLMALLQSMKREKIGLAQRFTLFFRFGIIDTRPLKTPEKRLACFYALQRHYYRQRLTLAKEKLAHAEKQLVHRDVSQVIKAISQNSHDCLQAHLSQHLTPVEEINEGNYRRNFSAFLQRFPVIGSTTYSIISSVGSDNPLDYVIIDEASQQDILPGVFALACAHNVVIVGDRKQLPHVPAKLPFDITAPEAAYDCQRHSLLDSVLSVYGKNLPVTLLKEHYRCHPKIIQFCNKQFYDNQLIAMTRDRGEKALSLVITAKGNHNRDNSNLREIESMNALDWQEQSQRGFIAPYNAQVDLSEGYLGQDFVSATVHKFQGRECDEIVFSTVLDKKASSKSLAFVDDPQLINVAVSRAKRHFTLVTGDNVFTQKNQHIAALIRYMQYYADNDNVYQSPVVSAFDLLYEEYDQSLDTLKARLNPEDSNYKSEQIAARLIKDALKLAQFSSLQLHNQIPLKQLIIAPSSLFTSREEQFMNQGASCDFVLYYRVGKQPLGVIEVDGGQHAETLQAERDQLKQSVLDKCDIPLLRLRTIDSHIEEKIADFLNKALHREQTGLLVSPQSA
ncbi:AAA domain-containing protein [Pantoea sp. BRR-3P]|uniref:AAA domain-containing protein n=1 Tax=Pantoea sp. BRR-3P TaxID=3141541 RepID=UPI0031F561B5